MDVIFVNEGFFYRMFGIKDAAPLMPFLAVAVVAYILRLFQGRKTATFLAGCLDVVTAIFSGVFVGAIIEIYPYPMMSKIAIAGLASFIGPDLVGGLLTIANAFRASPDQFILKYIYAFKGVKTGMDIPLPTPAAPPTDQKQET